MRFRIDLKSVHAHYGDTGNIGRYHVLVDGQRRGLTAIRDAHGYWSAEIVGVPLVRGLWDQERLEEWLQRNVDADILLPRPAEPQFEMEV